ncbi:hypothetical protein BJY01DRAFT_251059 [Aspergillus pseudoustus]|uniref:Actin cortical patch SUR7/pH-response regulator pali n=1 Tax=Aspergillus pseudoustus TaxID=1810923 RepID=A0ABR4JH11_9EURO
MAPKKAGVKAKKGKKGVKAGAKKGRKNGVRQSTSSLYVPQAPSHPSSTYIAPSEVYGPSKKRKGSTCALACFAVFTYLAAIVLGVFVAVGCINSTSAIKGVYIAEFHTNETYDFSLRFGYFGGCVTVTEPDVATSSGGNSSDRVLTHCVASLRDQDLADVSESFWENLDSSTSSITQYVQDQLNTTLPIVDHLQDDVFHWPVPVIHVLLFTLSGAMLFAACAGTSRRKAWKGLLVFVLTLSAFSLALSLATVLGTLQAMNALLEGSLSTDDLELENGVYLSRGTAMHAIQTGLVVIVVLFYVLMGSLFAQRAPEGVAFIQMFQSAGAGFREKARWR